MPTHETLDDEQNGTRDASWRHDDGRRDAPLGHVEAG